MCRIAGIINKDAKHQELVDWVTSMCDLMAHGGPDGEGTYTNEKTGLVFGHRRLAIIELSTAGSQPMCYDDGQLTITFNGEIYNYQTLQKELTSLGFSFHTKSDTEVILAGFACWGTAVFEKLNGMFAFALYDQRANLTYLVRDRSGIKPLFYHIENKQLTFASEVKAFKYLVTEEDVNWKIYHLAFGHIPEPYTTLKDVRSIQKGHYLQWDHQTDRAAFHQFHQEDNHVSITSVKAAEEMVKTQLEAAVQRHMIADAPIGVFLSGGIDSSLLTLLANEIQRETGQQLHTVSINFNQPKFSEKDYQEIIVNKIDGTNQSYTIDKATFNFHFEEALSAMDQPTSDGINSWFINYYAKQNGLKAVLSGIGADELFGGYPSFNRMGSVNLLSQLPSSALKIGRVGKSGRLKRLYYLSYKNTVGKYLFLRGFFTPDEISKLLDISRTKVDEVLQHMKVPALPTSLSNKEQASWLETNMYMQNQLLRDTDFMSMQHGVEVRIPFLDQNLLSSLLKISPSIRFQQKPKKALLINSFLGLLPEKIWNRPKMGFTFPFEDWLKDNNHFLAGLSHSKNERITALIADFKQGKLHWSKAMAIYHILNNGN